MTLGIGILGTGRIADYAFAPAVKATSGAKVVAVLSRDKARGEAFAAKHDAAGVYTSLDSLLADKTVDAVIIATPDVMHEPQAIAAARAGKHILCEKPMATTVAGCERMKQAVDKAGVTFQMGFSNRFNAGLRRIKAMIDEGAVGEVRYVRALMATPQNDPDGWRANPETARYWAMSACGTHLIDIFRWWFGEPARVGGVMLSPVYNQGNDEISTLVFDYPKQLLAELTVTAITPMGGNRIEVHGEKGVLIGDDVLGNSPKNRLTLNGEPVTVEPAVAFVGQVGEFVSAVTGKRQPRVTLEDGLRNVRIMEAVRERQMLFDI